ncbi:membrane protein DedA with SNARE-associated domain [Bacillus ectoiniformans]|uniref:DedA family protein n=1 Tax=Bacillus ectoiniformans TaxID=1494429 RepID=UPI00195C1245|nr:DedA family protein [Bacillus ectoiniformans]MBM7647683.1 membrane protein DedA with SNARE-associated domain [Bacillus ectoiniformans]
MEQWITDILNQFGYAGILLLLAIENIFPPIPSEIILLFSGFMTTQSSLSVGGVVTFSTIGSVIGAVVLYGMGMQIELSTIVKWAKRVRLSPATIYKVYDWFHHRGVWAVFFCRLIPGMRSLISIPAGMSRMNFSLFIVFTASGTFLWNLILVNIGASVGASWTTIIAYLKVYSYMVYGVLGGLGILFMLVKMQTKS